VTRHFAIARASLFGCGGQLDTVELELGRGARDCQFAEAGEDFADAARVVVEGCPLFSERIDALTLKSCSMPNWLTYPLVARHIRGGAQPRAVSSW
jgi:hypothetical protein